MFLASSCLFLAVSEQPESAPLMKGSGKLNGQPWGFGGIMTIISSQFADHNKYTHILSLHNGIIIKTRTEIAIEMECFYQQDMTSS
jgi:hypothetical protein